MSFERSRMMKIGDFTSWKSGGTPSKSKEEYWNGNIPWISAKTFKSNRIFESETMITELGLAHGSRLAQIDSILLLVRGSGLFNDIPIGLVTNPVAFNQDIKAISVDQEIVLPEYFLYWLIANKPLLRGLLEFTGIGAGKFDTNIIQNLDVDIPEINNQRKILRFAKALDEKIELNRQTNATLEAIAQAIFKEWFVDFNFPGATGEMVDSELGPIPAGWRIGQLGDVCELVYGKSLIAKKRIPGNYPVIGSNGIVGFHDNYLVKGPGIVTGRKGTIGEITWIHRNFFPIDTTFYVRDLLETNDLYFHYFLLSQQNFKRISSDSAVPGLNRNQAHELTAIIPKIELIKKFNNFAAPIFEEIFILSQESDSLANIRDALLPKLMRGEIPL